MARSSAPALDLATLEAYRAWRDGVTVRVRAQLAFDAAPTVTARALATTTLERAMGVASRARGDFCELVEADGAGRA
jgi:hypothetical protein